MKRKKISRFELGVAHTSMDVQTVALLDEYEAIAPGAITHADRMLFARAFEDYRTLHEAAREDRILGSFVHNLIDHDLPDDPIVTLREVVELNEYKNHRLDIAVERRGLTRAEAVGSWDEDIVLMPNMVLQAQERFLRDSANT